MTLVLSCWKEIWYFPIKLENPVIICWIIQTSLVLILTRSIWSTCNFVLHEEQPNLAIPICTQHLASQGCTCTRTTGSRDGMMKLQAILIWTGLVPHWPVWTLLMHANDRFQHSFVTPVLTISQSHGVWAMGKMSQRCRNSLHIMTKLVEIRVKRQNN